MNDAIPVAILGATGYAGEGTVRILLGHPGFELVHVGSDRLAGGKLSTAIPALAGECDLVLQPDTPEQLIASGAEAIVLAKKSPEVTQVVPQLLKAGKRIIDIGAEFRLRDINVYNQFYQGPHDCPEVLSDAVYGLSEVHTGTISGAQLVGNPGCYATSMLLPLAPLISKALIKLSAPIVNVGYSGLSGAGKRFIASNNNLFYACNENLHSYKALAHQHQAEVDQELSALGGEAVHVQFIPHLAPITRGILSTMSCQLKEGVSRVEVEQAWEEAYADKPFIRIRSSCQGVEVTNVAGTNYCDFAAAVDGDCLVITSAIDNLIKGASGQAVQNLNLMYGLPETMGLTGRGM